MTESVFNIYNVLPDFASVDYCKGSEWALQHMFDQMEVPSRPKIAFVDWIRCTTTNIVAFSKFSKYAFTRLKELGYDVWDTGKGISGYTHCFAISYSGERVGSFACDALDKMGGMFELTGLGCQMMQANWLEWNKLMFSLSASGFGITRLDVSTDLNGVSWHNYNHNIVSLHAMAYKGLFRIGNGGNAPSMSTLGDWSPLIVGDVTAETYNPSLNCEGGLSFTIGKRESQNSILCYEKGKQLLGSGYFENLNTVDASWVRIERRFTRGSGRSKVVIPFDFAVHCDDSLVYKCDGLDSFLSNYMAWMKDTGVGSIREGNISLVNVGLAQGKKLLKKAYWGHKHAGRLIKTLLTMGIDAVTVCSLLEGNEPIKGFIDNLTTNDDMAEAIRGFKRYVC